MKNAIQITARAFPVLAHDHRTGTEKSITVTVTKDQQGYSVIEIGTPDKLTLSVDLDRLVEEYEEAVD